MYAYSLLNFYLITQDRTEKDPVKSKSLGTKNVRKKQLKFK
jgi:hypothetical protein